MIPKTRPFSRAGHAAWASIALFFASVCALEAGVLELGLEDCAGCGGFGLGSLCSGPGPDFCSGTLALAVALLTITTGLCVLFAIHATSAFRRKRGLPVGSFLSSMGWTRPVVLQVLALTILSEGVEIVLLGLVMSQHLFTFHGGCGGCVVGPYPLDGLALWVTIAGAAVTLAGSIFVLFEFWHPARSMRIPTA
jgi:hypothetical protein